MARILVCDDAADLRMVMCLTMQADRHTTLEAEDGLAALRILQTDDDIDLLILDVQMPGVDGWHVLRTIRDDIRLKELPVLMCTVKLSKDDLEHAWALGCDGYINKPFDIPELSAATSDILLRSDVQRRRIRAMTRQQLQDAIHSPST